MNKKVTGLILTTFTLFLFLMNFISADLITDATEYSSEIFNRVLKPLAGFLFGGKDNISGELLFAKILFFIIIISIIWKSLEQIDFISEHEGVHWLIAISTSLLAIRWLGSKAIIQTIILPYSVMGIVLSAGIPFILWFIIINKGFSGPKNKTIRRIAWIFFSVVFIGLWISRRPELLAQNSKAGFIYPITALLAFLIAWFDGTIQKFFLKMELEKVGVQTKRNAIDFYKQKLAKLPELIQEDVISQKEAKKREKEYKKRIARFSK